MFCSCETSWSIMRPGVGCCSVCSKNILNYSWFFLWTNDNPTQQECCTCAETISHLSLIGWNHWQRCLNTNIFMLFILCAMAQWFTALASNSLHPVDPGSNPCSSLLMWHLNCWQERIADRIFILHVILCCDIVLQYWIAISNVILLKSMIHTCDIA